MKENNEYLASLNLAPIAAKETKKRGKSKEATEDGDGKPACKARTTTFAVPQVVSLHASLHTALHASLHTALHTSLHISLHISLHTCAALVAASVSGRYLPDVLCWSPLVLQVVAYEVPSEEAQITTFGESEAATEYREIDLKEHAFFEKGQLIAKLFETSNDAGNPVCEFFVGRVTRTTKAGPWVKFISDDQEIKQVSRKIRTRCSTHTHTHPALGKLLAPPPPTLPSFNIHDQQRVCERACWGASVFVNARRRWCDTDRLVGWARHSMASCYTTCSTTCNTLAHTLAHSV
jgi:hypothetical protein